MSTTSAATYDNRRRDMKRIIAALTLVLTLGSGIAFGQDRTDVQAGLKMWLNDWEVDDPVFGTSTSDTVMLIGPALNIMFPNHLFLDASYMFSTSDYKFSDIDAKVERQDLEASIGYMVVDEFGLVAGYKNSWFKQPDAGAKLSIYGPMLGLLAELPVNEAFSFYGSVNYLFAKTKSEESTGSSTEDSPGWMSEVGLEYAFTLDFTGKLGYKYQTTKGKDLDIKDSFEGLTLSALFTF
jgi:opacity protein-like surface antigen